MTMTFSSHPRMCAQAYMNTNTKQWPLDGQKVRQRNNKKWGEKWKRNNQIFIDVEGSTALAYHTNWQWHFPDSRMLVESGRKDDERVHFSCPQTDENICGILLYFFAEPHTETHSVAALWTSQRMWDCDISGRLCQPAYKRDTTEERQQTVTESLNLQNTCLILVFICTTLDNKRT